MESACCLLFYDSLADHRAIDTNVRSMKEAMECLASMVDTGPVPGVMATLQRMLYELEHVVNRNAASSLSISAGNATTTAGQQRQQQQYGGTTRAQETTRPRDPAADVATAAAAAAVPGIPGIPDIALLPHIESGTDQFCMDWSHTLPSMNNLLDDDDLFGPDLGDYWIPPRPYNRGNAPVEQLT